MNYYELNFSYTTSIEKEIINDILASELGEIGFESFVERDEGLDGFIGEKFYDETALSDRLSRFPLEGVFIRYTQKLVPGQDWNEEWEKKYFQPILIGKECMIRASYHTDLPQTDYDIVIDPKMAFGTGSHETTFLMLSQLLKLDLKGKEFLDMGCGTAVLAILASMKQAARIVAVDIDEWAYENALHNIEINQTSRIEVRLGGVEQLASAGMFDVVFANINRNILLNDIHSYVAHLKSEAHLYMSGFYEEDIPAIRAECERNGLKYIGFVEKNNWVAVHFEKK